VIEVSWPQQKKLTSQKSESLKSRLLGSNSVVNKKQTSKISFVGKSARFFWMID
jgi:hypothetical protein